MKLIRFALGDAKPSFGIVIGEHAIAFTSLQQRSGITPQLGEAADLAEADSEYVDVKLSVCGTKFWFRNKQSLA